MTVFASLALFQIVRVVVTMTAYTGDCERNLEDRFNMAIDTRDCQVRPFYPVVGIPVVIECDRWPVFGYVTGFAPRAKMTVMVVLLEVT